MKKDSTTPRRREVDAVRKKDHSFAVDLMEHLVVPTFVLDAHCRVLIWNLACERLTGVAATEVIGTSEHWRAFYGEPRPCLADLIAQGRTEDIRENYAQHDAFSELAFGVYAENWCVMPMVGTRLYLAIDAGPIYGDAGELIAVVETLRDMTAQREAQTALQELATRDGLTGIANRRTFDEALGAEWRRGIRESKPLSLLMTDVDFFKPYNDTYGHQQGDECLKLVASTMARTVLRAGDLVARYGGEEFAVVLPSTTAKGAAIVAERIRDAVARLTLPHAKSEVSAHVTISVGVATAVPTLTVEPARLVAVADDALYRAKHGGRNRVVTVELNE